MLRFEDVSQEEVDLLEKIRSEEESFNFIRDAKVKLLFDLKKRKSNSGFVLGRTIKSNDLIRKFSDRETDEGYDIVICLDKKCWENIGEEDKIRIMRHELQHIGVNDNGFTINPHEIEDFYQEIELNSSDPKWRERVETLTAALYNEDE